MQDKNFILIGGGITAMLISWILREKNKNANIYIIESSSNLGGQYYSEIYENKYIFDKGMHLFYPPDDERIKSIFFEILPKKDWEILKDNKKDIAGIYYNKKLQTYSQYPDLRNFSPIILKKFITTFFNNINRTNTSKTHNCEDLFTKKFGKYIYSKIHKPILINLYKKNPKFLHPIVAKLTGLDRVILFDKEMVKRFFSIKKINDSLGYPDQLGLPFIRSKDFRIGLYPKKFGLKYFVDIFEKKLIEKNIKIYKNSENINVIFEKRHITKINFVYCKKFIEIKTDKIISTINPFQIANLLKIKLTNKGSSMNKFSLIHILLNKKLNVENLYYVYPYDPKINIFRITNYNNYCKNAEYEGNFPYTIEFWERESSDNANSNKNLLDQVKKELKIMNLLDDQTKVIKYWINKNSGVFPIITNELMRTISLINQKVKNKKIKNLISIGMFSDNKAFFFADIMKLLSKLINKL